MWSSITVAVLGLCIVNVVQIANGEKVNISVYYEALCPDSINFMDGQLNTTFAKIGDYLNVDLIPYGKATQRKENGHWHFECQHGPRECQGNKLQACAINQAKPQKDLVEFVSCAMAYGVEDGKEDSHYEKCADEFGFSWNDMKNCSESDLGDELLAKYGDRTLNAHPVIVFVPTIVFNHKYDPFLQMEALRNLLSAACSLMREKPKECPFVKINEDWW